MKFKLYEDIPNISSKAISQWNKASDAERYRLTGTIIDNYNKPGLENIHKAIYRNFDYFGIDKNTNPYMKLLDELEFSPKKSYNANFGILTEFQKTHRVDLNHDYLRWESLYNRPQKDFEYTVTAFEIVMDRNEVSKYFNDITNIESSQFVDPETGDILPAGKPGDKGIDTIYGVIEQWSRDDEGKSNVPEQTSQFTYSLNDALKHFKVPYTQQLKVCVEWLKNYFRKAAQLVKPQSNDVDYYIEKISDIMSRDKIRLTNAEKDRILRDKQYSTPDDVPEYEKREGNIIFLRQRQHRSKGADLLADIVSAYVVYHNNEWIPYDRYIAEVTSDVKVKFLNMKTISILNDKVQVTAGIIRGVDRLVRDDLV